MLFNKEFKDYTDAEIITNETILRFCEINHKNFLISLKKFDLNHNLVDLTIFLFIKNYIHSNDLRFLNISLKNSSIKFHQNFILNKSISQNSKEY